MASLRCETVIRATPDEVFDVFVDVPSWPERIEGIESVELLDEGPVRDGTRFRETRIMFKKEAVEEMTFRDVERPHRYAVEAHSCGSHMRFDFELTPVDDGGAASTRVVMTSASRPETLFAKVMSVAMGWMMMGMMRKAIQKDLDDFKRSIEGGASVAAPA